MAFGLRSILMAVCIVHLLGVAIDCQKASVFNNFAFDLKKHFGSKNENLFFSPLSITGGILMTYFGSNDATAREKKNFLKLNQLNDNQILTVYRNHINALERIGPGANDFKINMANRLFVKQGVSINPSFKNQVRQNFKSDVQLLAFSNTVQSARIINDWVKRATSNKITRIVTPSALGADSKMILANAASFKGAWKFPFDRRRTQKKDFFMSDGQPKTVDMMISSSALNLRCKINSKRIDGHACELPFVGDKVSMIVFLPLDEFNPRDIEKKLNANTFDFVLKNLRATRVHVHLPKFRLEFRQELKCDLVDMGMVTPFSPLANFNKITGRKNDLSLSRVFHETLINVDERGIGVVGVPLVNQRLNHEFNFICNRPFLYVIYDKASQNILFMGKMVKP